MLSLGFSRRLHTDDFKHRVTPASRSRVVYRLARRSAHVELDRLEWEAMLADFSDRTRRVVRTAWGLMFALPFAILLFASMVGPFVPGAGLVIVVALFFGPSAIYLWQSYRVKGMARAMEAELARRAKAAPPRKRGPLRPPRWMEIAVMVLFGPHLILEIYGSLEPHGFDGTPLMYTQLDRMGIAGFLLLATLLFMRWRADRYVAPEGLEADGPAPLGPATEPEGRKIDYLARARGSRS